MITYSIANRSKSRGVERGGGKGREIKVIPLKLFYYQTFFETWRNEHSWYEHYKNAIKKWGHRACLRVSRLLKWGIFYWLRVRSSNHLHTELNLGT